MICPVCRSEYRPEFTRCATCDVDLVHELPAEPEKPERRPATPMVDYCGFFSLDEAREAREQLRGSGIGAEIAIRDRTDGEPSTAEEEYWLRVGTHDLRSAARILGYDAAAEDAAADATFACSECGQRVRAQESFCAHCGARFE